MQIGTTSRRAALAAAAALVGALLLGPEPARADSDFEIGFERELGRIAAREAVHLGRHVLGGLYRDHGRPYGHRGHHRRHLAGHRYGYWHDHGYLAGSYGYRAVRSHRLRFDRHRGDRHDRHHRHGRHCRH